MNKEFLQHCDMLLKVLPNRIILEQSEVAKLLNVSEQYAQTVAERLRNDGLADVTGWGPVSRNHRTSTFPDYYTDEIKRLKDERRTELYARWGFWIAVISVAWQILEWILGAIGKIG